MKLLFCDKCFDVFKLDLKLRQCKCGRVKGKYLSDNWHAEVNGNGISLAIDNNSFAPKLREFLSGSEDNKDPYNLYSFHGWIRQHDGKFNPHTIINKDL